MDFITEWRSYTAVPRAEILPQSFRLNQSYSSFQLADRGVRLSTSSRGENAYMKIKDEINKIREMEGKIHLKMLYQTAQVTLKYFSSLVRSQVRY